MARIKGINQIKAILFDLDDTLIASGEAIITHHQKIAAMLGLRVPSYDEVGKVVGIPWDGVLKQLWPEADIEEFKKVYRQNDKETEITLIKGADELLKKLKKSFILGLITSRDEESSVRYTKKLEIFDFFDSFITANHKYTKPDPRVFDSTLKELEKKGIKKEEVLFVGDSLIDFEAAQKAGIKFTAVLTGTYTKEEFEKAGANEIISSVAGLKECLF